MARRPSLYTQKALHHWTEELAGVFPELSQPQVAGLAAWRFGMVLARSCALTAVAFSLAKLLGQKVNSARQRLRAFYQEADAKKGEHRRDLDSTTCFAPLLRWLLRDWQGQPLALAVDASTLGTRFVVLCVRVVYRGCAIPVAWKVLSATAQGSWQEPGLQLLAQCHGLVPAGWTVLVLADRGLWAKWLFEGIRNLGWHPLLRINQGGKFRPQGGLHFVPLASLAPCVGSRGRGRGTAFATAPLACTLLVFWGAGPKEAWLVLTDRPPELSDASWYSLRTWSEQFFKDSKRGGWQGPRTRMTDPARAERLWLAVAVATWGLVRLGGADEVAEATAATALLELQRVSDAERPKRRRWRLVSGLARGGTVLLVALINHERLPLGQFVPEPWPAVRQLPEPTQIPSQTPCVA